MVIREISIDIIQSGLILVSKYVFVTTFGHSFVCRLLHVWIYGWMDGWLDGYMDESLYIRFIDVGWC